MKLIFLDIDGVFNSEAWRQNPLFSTKPYPYNLFDPTTVSLFNNIIEETQAKIVITSTWRLKYSLNELQNIFNEVGFACEIIDYTPNLKKGTDYILRGNEILKWCKGNKKILGVKYIDYKDYVIIDDNSDMLFWQAANFFQTDKKCGLSSELSQRIIRLLK
jgi:hypothetical protein